jgi:mitogen-activated protein kinase kinase kinase
MGNHVRGQSSVDGSLMAALPEHQDMIRVIAMDGVTRVFKVSECQTIDDVMRLTLRKFGYREDHERNYCFWTLAGLEPDPAACRRLFEQELWRIIKDPKRPERNRLILRKIHAGEPSDAELQRAADIAQEESAAQHNRVMEHTLKRQQSKAEKILGETWDHYPLPNESYAAERERNIYNTAEALERPPSIEILPIRRQPRGKNDILRQFFGQRPPSELITSDLTTYFPNQSKEEIDRTARLSLRRSQRLSRVHSRLSVMSNLSFASSMKDAPPMPRIEDTWLNNDLSAGKQLRVLDRGHSIYRDSVASSMLEPLQEESPVEPNRKSYVSFDSGSDTIATTNVSITDPDGNVTSSFFEDGSTEAGGSLRDVTQALNEDGEEVDEDLQSFLAGDSWDDTKWMRGALIGQGSFGSVYLALHAVTGELLAVKQVELPSPGNSTAVDQKKKNMIDALKREITLLRELQHPNIVQYLGCSSSPDHLNIFLEYVPGGSVQTMLNSYGALREPLVRSFVRQIVTGLAYLHGRDIIHRDIKGANILVDNKGGIKISDFGISKKMEATNYLKGPAHSKNRPSMQGSVFWMAPEVVKQTRYTRKSDVWSLGCLVVEMMTGNHPFPDCNQFQALYQIGNGKASPTIPEGASEEAKHFLRQTFMIDDAERPDANELLLSPFLNPCT